MIVECEYEYVRYELGYFYTCKLSSLAVTSPGVEIESIVGSHLNGKFDDDVKAVWFVDAVVQFVPRGVPKFFKNLTILAIIDTGLVEITKADLAGFEKIREITLCFNNLTWLPDDLFCGMTHLEMILMNGNKIESMSSKILEPLSKTILTAVSFRNNARIDSRYQKKHHEQTISLKQLMRKIDNNCFPQRN